MVLRGCSLFTVQLLKQKELLVQSLDFEANKNKALNHICLLLRNFTEANPVGLRTISLF